MITVNLLVAFNLAGVPKAKQVLSSDSIATKMWLSLQSWWRSFSLRWGSSVTENQQHQDIKCILSSKRIFRWFGEVWCYSGVLATKLPIMGKSPLQSPWICPKLTGTWEIMIFNDPWLRIASPIPNYLNQHFDRLHQLQNLGAMLDSLDNPMRFCCMYAVLGQSNGQGSTRIKTTIRQTDKPIHLIQNFIQKKELLNKFLCQMYSYKKSW